MKTLIALALVVLTATVAAVAAPLSPAASTALGPAEVDGLRYMREEEKMARDVYRALAVKWPSATVFARIAQSEQRHMDAVRVVLDRYGVADPAAGKAAGKFADPELQKMYDELVAEGKGSLQAALGVGVKIEKADIADLEQELAATGNADLERLYGHLLASSKNHLRAFSGNATGAMPGAGQGRMAQKGPHGSGTCTQDGPQQGSGPMWGRGNGPGPRFGTAA